MSDIIIMNVYYIIMHVYCIIMYTHKIQLVFKTVFYRATRTVGVHSYIIIHTGELAQLGVVLWDTPSKETYH